MAKLDSKALAQQMVEAVRRFVVRSEATLGKRIGETEARLVALVSKVEEFLNQPPAAGLSSEEIACILQKVREEIPAPRDGRDGKDADPEAIRTLVEATVGALPKAQDGRDGKDVDPEAVKALIAEAVVALPKPRDGKDVDPADVGAMVQQAVAALPPPRDGRDADPEVISALIAEAVDALPKPLDGKDGASVELKKVVAALQPIVTGLLGEEVHRAVAALPKAQDGRDGKDADPELIQVAVAEAVAALPAPRDGKDGRNGESVHQDTVARMIADEVSKAIAALPRAKDGESGRDAAELQVLPSLDEARSYRRGTWASYGGGLVRAERDTDPITEGVVKAGWVVMVEGLAAVVVSQGDDPRQLTVAAMLTSGAKTVCEFSVPLIIYKGVWREGEYQQGDVATWGGSGWHCQRLTTDKPGTSDAWKLMVKEGARGKDANAPVKPPREPVRIK